MAFAGKQGGPMERDTPQVGAKALLTLDGLQGLVTALTARGYQVLGPTLRDGAIIYDTVAAVADLPAGWTDRQDAGRYRVEHRADRALFGYAVGPHSWKRFLHPPMQRMWQARREGAEFSISPPQEAPQKM